MIPNTYYNKYLLYQIPIIPNTYYTKYQIQGDHDQYPRGVGAVEERLPGSRVVSALGLVYKWRDSRVQSCGAWWAHRGIISDKMLIFPFSLLVKRQSINIKKFLEIYWWCPLHSCGLVLMLISSSAGNRSRVWWVLRKLLLRVQCLMVLLYIDPQT